MAQSYTVYSQYSSRKLHTFAHSLSRTSTSPVPALPLTSMLRRLPFQLLTKRSRREYAVCPSVQSCGVHPHALTLSFIYWRGLSRRFLTDRVAPPGEAPCCFPPVEGIKTFDPPSRCWPSDPCPVPVFLPDPVPAPALLRSAFPLVVLSG